MTESVAPFNVTQPWVDSNGRLQPIAVMMLNQIWERLFKPVGDGGIESLADLTAYTQENIDRIDSELNGLEFLILDNDEAIAYVRSISESNTTSISSHVVQTAAHGSDGDIVGANKSATLAVTGLVNKSTSVSPVVDTPTGADTVNEAALTELQTQFNDLLAKLKAAGVVDT